VKGGEAMKRYLFVSLIMVCACSVLLVLYSCGPIGVEGDGGVIDAEIRTVNVSCDYEDEFFFPELCGSSVVFVGYGDESGEALYTCVDGEVKGTAKAATCDFEGFDSFIPLDFTGSYKNSVYFFGSGPSEQYGIYRYDGVEITNAPDSGESDYVDYFLYPISFKEELLFIGQGPNDIYKLYTYDGSSIESVPIAESCNYQEMFSMSTSVEVFLFVKSAIIYNEKLYFTGCFDPESDDQFMSYKVFEYDSTSIKNLAVAEGCSYESLFLFPTVYAGKLYFMDYNMNLMVYDGVEIKNASDEGNGDIGGGFLCPAVYNEKLCFLGGDGSEKTLFEYDGSTMRSVPVDPSCSFVGMDFEELIFFMLQSIVYDGKLYFPGMDEDSSFSMYEYDGTSVKDVKVGQCSYEQGFLFPFIFGGKLYFVDLDIDNENSLFVYDGSEIQDVVVSEGCTFTKIEFMVMGTSFFLWDLWFPQTIVCKNRVYFRGNDGTKNIVYGLW
jgi:hypothetical protein